MATITRDKKKKRVASLMEMGVSRAAAKAALRAKGWQTEEAALIVFEDAYAEAADIPTSDEEDAGPSGSGTGIVSSVPRSSGIDKGKQKSRDSHTKLPTPDEDETGTGGDRYEDEDDDDDDDDGGDFDYGDDEPFLDEGTTGFENSESADAPFGDGDAYGFLDIAKDRQVEIKEVEEAVRKVLVHKTERGEFARTDKKSLVEAEIFGLQRWLSGCPEGNEQQQLFPLYTSLTGQDLMPPKCPHKCGATIKHLESDFFAIPASFTAYLERVSNICQTACDKCGKGVCLACNDPCDLQDSAALDKFYTTAPEALLHCPTLQAVIIGVGLHLAGQMWDDVEAISKTIDAAAESSNSKKRKADSSSVSNSRAIRESYFSAGTGYGGSTSDDSGVRAAHKAQQEKDKKLAELLAQVRVYLPNRDRPGSFRDSDHMPAGQTLAHLRRRFNPIASLLLSADSLSDMSDRKDLYTEFMAWLQTMSAHENLAGLMGQPIMRAASVTLTESTNTSGKSQREKVILFQASPGPRELLERILSQVTVAKRVASAAQLREEALRREREEANGGTPDPAMNALESELTGNNKSVETKRMIDFCEIIEKAVASIDKALRQSSRGEAVLRKMQQNTASVSQPQGAPASTQKQSVEQEAISEEELKLAYVKWVKKTNYQFYDWSVEPADGASASTTNLAYKHVYTKEAAAIASHPARNTAMMKEHASLSSSLPADWSSSVFLLVDEGRPDIIKALIIGPDDTPYENGCFFFDILLGSNYNQSPPNVKSLTTKGGKYRLNPNLYAEGKVCLSLLGTWSGPGWVPGKSTLLQVLISIQSMILWSEPITNEPSFEREHKSPQSKAYNANVRRMVAHIAMLEYLVNPPEGFEEIVKTHFRLKAPALRKQLDRWIEEDDGQGLYADSMSALRGGRYGSLGLGSALNAAVQGATSPAVAASAAAPAAAAPAAVASAAANASTPSPGTSGTNTPVAATSAEPTASSSTQSQLARDVAAIKKLLEKLECEESKGI